MQPHRLVSSPPRAPRGGLPIPPMLMGQVDDHVEPRDPVAKVLQPGGTLPNRRFDGIGLANASIRRGTGVSPNLSQWEQVRARKSDAPGRFAEDRQRQTWRMGRAEAAHGVHCAREGDGAAGFVPRGAAQSPLAQPILRDRRVSRSGSAGAGGVQRRRYRAALRWRPGSARRSRAGSRDPRPHDSTRRRAG